MRVVSDLDVEEDGNLGGLYLNMLGQHVPQTGWLMMITLW